MTNNPITGPIGPQPIEPKGPDAVSPRKEAGGKSFKDVLLDQIKTVNELQKDADRAMESLATGETENISEVFVAVKKAQIAFNYMMQIHRKLVEAYEEIMRMRV